MEDFKAQLPGVDSKILQMRYDGHSLKEIAAAVGFKTPSAVSKHVEKIAERYDNFISDEYGKLVLTKLLWRIIMSTISQTRAICFSKIDFQKNNS